MLQEINEYKSENENILEEVKTMLISEGEVFKKSMETLEDENSLSAIIQRDFDEIDVLI